MSKTTIKELRAANKLTQAAFAKAVGISAASVAAYEAGRIQPSEKVAARIRELYGAELKSAAAKKPAAKKAAAKKPAATKTPAKKRAAKKPAGAEVVIQSPMGGSITPEEIRAKVGPADRIYVRVDENKAYWVRGEETGSVDLW